MVEQIQPQIQASPVVQQPVTKTEKKLNQSDSQKEKTKWWVWFLVISNLLILALLTYSIFFG